MALLSKEERQTLTPDEKRALRKERRAVRREERGPILGIRWEKLEPLAEELILEIAGDLLPGEEKYRLDEGIRKRRCCQRPPRSSGQEAPI